ncbi:MAG: hypothetical protein GQ535_11090 [Rhodobacteraceae bacterium]|nr:hypothetical protein [Paracoccaceae bacterium]
MVAPIIWAGFAIAGLFTVSETVEKSGEAAEKFATLAKWTAVAGGIYVSYAALKTTGVLK